VRPESVAVLLHELPGVSNLIVEIFSSALAGQARMEGLREAATLHVLLLSLNN
jgi:hypothetical protein